MSDQVDAEVWFGTNVALAFYTSIKTCCIGRCFPLVLMEFLRNQIAYTIVAKRFKSVPFSVKYSTKSLKLKKCGLAL